MHNIMATRRLTRATASTSTTPAPAPAPVALVAPAPAPTALTSAPATAPVDRRIAPNGIHADLFASDVGIVTRQNAPLDVEKWSLVGDDVKKKICDLVLEKFDIADTQVMHKMILAKVNICYQSWRSRLREHYELYQTDEKRLQNPPNNVLPETWENLVSYFGSPSFQEKSLRKKDNSKHHVVPHIVDRRTFQVVRHDWDDIRCMLDESYDSKNLLTPNEAFLLVRGEKSGASYGIKASKSKLRIQAQLQEAMQDREELTKEIDVLKEKLEEQQTHHEEELAQMKAQLEAQQAIVNSFITHFENERN
ncbi:hypothetical protein Ahy_A07g035261 [Arachis hypogaea]|uniref:Uncharacterized protein n=1 Tax=Arachis hypogaea TaxID=3818 RepID=A0A445CDJ4_ARAHY|nr:hypothetical protein Ahy_A07g035261 [Arachis hypogaea]